MLSEIENWKSRQGRGLLDFGSILLAAINGQVPLMAPLPSMAKRWPVPMAPCSGLCQWCHAVDLTIDGEGSASLMVRRAIQVFEAFWT